MTALSPAPRPRDAAASRARILAAAIQCFSERGYAHTGIRDVAAAAGVSYALLGKYYGSKAGLFEATLQATARIDAVIAVERARFGDHLATLIIENLKDSLPLSLTLLATGDPDSRAIALTFLEDRVVRPLADWLGGENARERAVAIVMQGAGFVLYTQHMPLMAVPVSLETPAARRLADAFQRIVDEDQVQANSNILTTSPRT